ncbi:MAG: hypothetical protein HOP34_14210 [Methylococcaceae bacterium]|nr:hypothetical protein [Methylococcaceae bacterium]
MSIDYNKEKWEKLHGTMYVKVLVIETENYIVFLDPDFDLDWVTTKEYDDKGHDNNTKHNDILNKVALLECKPTNCFDEKTRLNYKRLLGEALARSLGHDYVRAGNILEKAESYIKERGKELARQWYLDRAGKTVILFLAVGIFAWVFRECVIGIIGRTVFILSLAVIAGALGALLSIIFRMGKEGLDCLSGKEAHQLESMYRIIAGMLSALLGALLVQSGIVLPVLSKVNNVEVGTILIGFIAGMSEQFAPSMMQKIENGNSKGSTR